MREEDGRLHEGNGWEIRFLHDFTICDTAQVVGAVSASTAGAIFSA